jgi:hypothetical protein
VKLGLEAIGKEATNALSETLERETGDDDKKYILRDPSRESPNKDSIVCRGKTAGFFLLA